MRATLGEPTDEAELIRRARALAGLTLPELERLAHGPASLCEASSASGAISSEASERPISSLRRKGRVGQLVERALGAPGGSSRGPDLPTLGVELKTIPLNRQGVPQETTFVCTVPLSELPYTDFEQSVLRQRLARVLFVPIESEPGLPYEQRRVGQALLWSPSPAELALLRQDWERVARLVTAGEVESITGHLGEVLQVRPKAANASVHRVLETEDGQVQWVRPRGFYLRRTFTAAIVRAGLTES